MRCRLPRASLIPDGGGIRAAVETTRYALGVSENASDWFKLLIVYDVVFVVASYLGFEYVMEE